MRETLRHGPGRVFLAVLIATVAVVFAAPLVFGRAEPLLGVVHVPFATGFIIIAVMLPAYLVYFKRYWPFR